MSAARYVILGAGAVGGVIGSRLAEHGHPVLMLSRGAHAEAIRRDGLRLAQPDGVTQQKIPVAATADEIDFLPGDVLILASKSQDTAAIVESIAYRPVGDSTVGETLPLVCAQNSVSNEYRALRYFRRVYGICVVLPAVMLEAGRIDSHGSPRSGALDVGRYPSGIDEVAEQVSAVLNMSGFFSKPREDIMSWKHAKLLENLNNVVEAIMGRDLDEEGRREYAEFTELVQAEARECFAAAGVTVVDRADWRAHRDQIGDELVEGRTRAGGSSWQSAARGAGRIETDFLNGEIALLGRLHGIPTPVNAFLQRMGAEAVAEKRPPGQVRPGQLTQWLAGGR